MTLKNSAKIRILFVEDHPDPWKEFIADIVSPIQCEFDVKPNDNKIIDWVEKASVEKSYDLIICNLKYDFDKFGGGVQAYYGLMFLERLRERYADFPVFVLSSVDWPTRDESMTKMAELYSRYNVRHVAYRGVNMPFDHKLFQEKFIEVVKAKKAKKWVSSDGQASIDAGGIRDILDGLEKSSLNEALCKNYWDGICYLAGGTEDRRMYYAVDLWRKLWLEESNLPYLPLIEILVEAEFSGEMYKGYRDHVAHSIWVYFLGLYLYYQNAPIRNAMNTVFSENDFLFAWKVAALFHDVGYAGDRGVDAEKESKIFSRFLVELQKFLDYPLREYCNARKIKLSERDEEDLAQLVDLHIPRIGDSLDSIEKMPVGMGRVLDLIEELAIPTQLAQEDRTTPLGDYYQFAKVCKPKNRERFRDHGILSALILLYQFEFFSTFLTRLQGKVLPKQISRKTRQALKQIISGCPTESVSTLVKRAAFAIALHNIDVSIWETEEAQRNNLSLDDYRIVLDKTPLAFLLAMTDVLQCWGRPRRGYVSDPKHLSLLSQNVRVVCNGDVIEWAVNKDKQLGFSPTEEIEAMSVYMSCHGEDDLWSLIKEGEFSS